MEAIDEKIKAFLSVDYGDGSGSGDGSGDGDGSGYGYGDGSGSGSGSGSGMKEFNGRKVYMIDGVPTLIDSLSGTYAKGAILQSDFTLTPCYIAKCGNSFAHGSTLREAARDAQAKELKHCPIEKRISMFRNEYPDPDSKIPARQLWQWHNTLTGSCEAGRNAFARDHDINIDSDLFSVREFILLTCNAYGAENIRRLAEAYNITLNK